MTVYDAALTVGVLLALFVLAYCHLKKVTLMELIREIREGFQGETEEIRL